MAGKIPVHPEQTRCVRELAGILDERANIIASLIAVLIDHESARSVRTETTRIDEPVAHVLPLMLQAVNSSTRTVVALSTDVTFCVRDCYSISRSILELALNACFILARGPQLAERAIRHAEQKSYRDTQRESKVGKSIINVSVNPKIVPSSVPGLEAALDEFSSKSGAEKGNWVDESVDERLAQVGQRFGDDVLTELHLARFMIYRHASDILHGTFFSALYFFGKTTGSRTLDESAKNIGDQHINLLIACGFALEAVVKSFDLTYGFQWGAKRSRELTKALSELTCLSGTGDSGSPSHVQPEPAETPVFYSFGAGNASCKDYLAVKGKGNVDLRVSEWLSGFVTSYNLYAAKQVLLVDEAAAAFIEKYCRDSPSKTVVQAAEAFVRELGGVHGKSFGAVRTDETDRKHHGEDS